MNQVIEALSLLTPYDIDKQKIRIGPNRDGGYILADSLSASQTVLSYGISDEYSFDEEMARRGHTVYMFDHTIIPITPGCDGMIFHNEGVSGETDSINNLYSIGDHLAKYNIQGAGLILKMDVEGAELDAIGMAADAVLQRFEQIVFEIHNLTQLTNEHLQKKVVQCLTRLNTLFTLFHVHANNHDGPDAIHTISGCQISDLLELSYVKSSSIRRFPSRTLYPTHLIIRMCLALRINCFGSIRSCRHYQIKQSSMSVSAKDLRPDWSIGMDRILPFISKLRKAVYLNSLSQMIHKAP